MSRRTLALAALLTAAPFLLYPVFVAKILCFALFACAFDLLLGQTGLLSFGHAAFFGVGGYAAGALLQTVGLSPELAILGAGLIAALLGGAVGFLAVRRDGVTFTMITLALAQLVYFICLEAPLTGGENGIQDIPRGALFGLLPMRSDLAAYAVIAGLFLGGFLLLARVIHSPFGQVLRAIRENETRAVSLGYQAARFKFLAFVISAAMAGVAGAAKAWLFGIATLSDVHWTMSGEVVLMVLLGGEGTALGPVVGAAVVVTLETYLASFGSWVSIVQGLIFMACVLTFRRGIVGVLSPATR